MDEPSVLAWDLRDGAYTEVARSVGDEPLRAGLPFEVTVIPAALRDL